MSPECPDCGGDLSESSSERGEYFCPSCTSPVKTREAIHWCPECGDVEVSYSNEWCPDCSPDRSGVDGDADGPVWGKHAWDEDDGLSVFAARDCPSCGMMIAPTRLAAIPLHDGEGNYYFANGCPNCGELFRRILPENEPEIEEETKEIARKDPDPPESLDDLDRFPTSL